MHHNTRVNHNKIIITWREEIKRKRDREIGRKQISRSLMIQDKNSGKSQVTQASSLSERLITQDYTSLSWLFADE